jgi:hypothetical protein
MLSESMEMICKLLRIIFGRYSGGLLSRFVADSIGDGCGCRAVFRLVSYAPAVSAGLDKVRMGLEKDYSDSG